MMALATMTPATSAAATTCVNYTTAAATPTIAAVVSKTTTTTTTTSTSTARFTNRQMLQVKVQSSESSKTVKNTLHHALGPFLVLSRFFGIFPASGVWPTDDVDQVQFKWIALPVLVTTILIGFATMDFFLTFKVMAEVGLKLSTTGPLSFSLECLSAFIVFLWLSRNWPNLIKSTRRLESIFLQKSYTCLESRKFSQRIRIMGSIFLFGSVVEHSFYVSSGIYSNYLQIKQCNLTVNFWRNYYLRERLQIFSIIGYTEWLIPLLLWITISMTFAWNFIDIFLILISQGLTIRFQQFNWRIQCHLKEHMSNEFWYEMRQDFLALTDLLWQFDNKLSSLILLSCAQNLLFLAVQIFHSFQHRDNFMMEIYFWFSLIFVIIRVSFMMVTAAGIHDTANAISSNIYEIPTTNWCLELKRLNEVIVSDFIALSGKGFFFLTRRLMIAMVGTIVVYELVLLDQVDRAESTPLCNQRKG